MDPENCLWTGTGSAGASVAVLDRAGLPVSGAAPVGTVPTSGVAGVAGAGCDGGAPADNEAPPLGGSSAAVEVVASAAAAAAQATVSVALRAKDIVSPRRSRRGAGILPGPAIVAFVAINQLAAISAAGLRARGLGRDGVERLPQE